MGISSIGGVSWAAQTATRNQTRQILPDPATAGLEIKNSDSTDTSSQFLDFMKLTPEQQMQQAWLAQHGVSQAQFDAMSPADKQKLIDQMTAEIKQKVKDKVEASTYKPTNIVA